VGDPQGQRHRSRPTADRAGLVTIPALPGGGDPGAAFFTVDLLDGTQAYVLAAIDHATRRINILELTLHPTGEWTTQQARNLILDLGDHAGRAKFMIRDRGSNFTTAFDAVLADAGIRTVLCSIQTPRMNAIIERWIGECRRELLDRTLVWNQTHLAAGPAPVRDPPQSAPAAPLPARRRAAPRRAAETATRAGRPRPVPHPKTSSGRWSDQRISPGGMTRTRLSACTVRSSAGPGRLAQSGRLACPATEHRGPP